MKKFVELNEKELMNVEGGATASGSASMNIYCGNVTTSVSYNADGNKTAGGAASIDVGKFCGVGTFGTIEVGSAASDYKKVSCKSFRRCYK